MTLVYIHLPTSQFYLVTEIDGTGHLRFEMPKELESYFEEDQFNISFYNNSECLGRL